jgi:hypothetical protein
MLIITRKRYEKFVIAGDVEITILEVGRNRVRFGVKAPKHIQIQTRVKTDADALPESGDDFNAASLTLQDFRLAVGLSKRV